MKCEQVECTNEVPSENVDRVCAYQADPDVCDPLDYNGALTCNCCDKCRRECHQGLLETNPPLPKE